MKEIKTICRRMDSGIFDTDVNEAIKQGFILKRRYVIPGRNLSENTFTHNMLVAELEREHPNSIGTDKKDA